MESDPAWRVQTSLRALSAASARFSFIIRKSITRRLYHNDTIPLKKIIPILFWKHKWNIYTLVFLNSNVLLKERERENDLTLKILITILIIFKSLNIRQGSLNYPEVKYHRSFIILRQENVARNEVNVRAWHVPGRKMTKLWNIFRTLP